MKVREYARHRGVSHVAVLKMIKSGRLKDSVVYDDKKRPIIDSELADKECLKTTKELFRDKPAKPISPIPREVKFEVLPPPNHDDDDLDAESKARMNFAESRAMREEYLAKLAKLEFEQKSEALIEAGEVARQWVAVASIVRTKILGIPSKLRQRLPELNHDQYILLEGIVRESLEDLSNVAAE